MPAPRCTTQHHAAPRSTTQHHAVPRSTTQHLFASSYSIFKELCSGREGTSLGSTKRRRVKKTRYLLSSFSSYCAVPSLPLFPSSPSYLMLYYVLSGLLTSSKKWVRIQNGTFFYYKQKQVCSPSTSFIILFIYLFVKIVICTFSHLLLSL